MSTVILLVCLPPYTVGSVTQLSTLPYLELLESVQITPTVPMQSPLIQTMISSLSQMQRLRSLSLAIGGRYSLLSETVEDLGHVFNTTRNLNNLELMLHVYESPGIVGPNSFVLPVKIEYN
jgi:hypothetical protein